MAKMLRSRNNGLVVKYTDQRYKANRDAWEVFDTEDEPEEVTIKPKAQPKKKAAAKVAEVNDPANLDGEVIDGLDD